LHVPEFVQGPISNLNQDEEAEAGLYIILAFIGFVIAILFSMFWSVAMFGLFFLQVDTSDSDDIITEPTQRSYTAEDASYSVTTGEDTLIKMQLNGRDDLAWSFVKVTLSVGDNVYTCSVAAGDDCSISQSAGSNDNAWEPGEYIFLSEETEEICSAQGCHVYISVTHNGRTVVGTGSVTVN